MRPYEHGGKYYDETIKYDLSENINPLGMPEEVRAVLVSCPEAFSKYPDVDYIKLREALSRAMNVKDTNICLGNGADELIWKIMEVYRPDSVLTVSPTFSEYLRCASAVGAKIHECMLRAEDDFSIGSDFITNLEKGYDLIFLCNPNNPTGKVIPRDQLVTIVSKAEDYNTTVVIDESFLDFTDEKSMAEVINDYDNLLILRGFTKIYGMAGIRLGYLIGPEKKVASIRDYGPLWNVSAVAMLSGLAALQSAGWIEKTREYVRKEKEYISSNILGVIRSEANFMLIKTREDMAERLYEKGIAVRCCENFHGLDSSYIRIGVKSHECNQAFVNAYKEIING